MEKMLLDILPYEVSELRHGGDPELAAAIRLTMISLVTRLLIVAAVYVFVVAVILLLRANELRSHTSPTVFGKLRRIHQAYFLLGCLWAAIIVGICVAYSNSYFANVYNSYIGSTSGVSYSNVIDYAISKGWENVPPSISASFPAMTLGFTAFYGYNYIVYMGGEVKRAQKTIPESLVISAVLFGLILAGLATVYYNLVGFDWMNAINWLYWAQGQDLGGVVVPFIQPFAALVTQNTGIVLLIMVTMFVGTGMLQYSTFTLAIERTVFAWAFDRVVPDRFAYVSERFHTPIVAVLLNFVGCLFFFLGSVFTPWFFAFQNPVGVGLVAISIISIGGIIFPFRRRDLFENAPGFVKAKIGGVPVISIVGLIAVITSVYTAYYGLFGGFVGPSQPPALALGVGYFVSGLVVYYVAKYYRKKTGLDLSMVFKEIPPE